MAVPSFGRHGQCCDQTVRCLSAAFLNAPPANHCKIMILLNVRWSFRPGRSARRLHHLYGHFARWPYQRSVVLASVSSCTSCYSICDNECVGSRRSPRADSGVLITEATPSDLGCEVITQLKSRPVPGALPKVVLIVQGGAPERAVR